MNALRPLGPSLILLPVPGEEERAPKHCINFRADSALQVVADRIKWKHSTSFNPGPYLSPQLKLAFEEPSVLRRPPSDWP